MRGRMRRVKTREGGREERLWRGERREGREGRESEGRRGGKIR